MESELHKNGLYGVPNPKDGIGTRIEEVARQFDSRKKAANAAGVSSSTLMRWISEESAPIFQQVGRLVFAAGYSLDWVYSGTGNKRPRTSWEQSAEAAPSVRDSSAYDSLDTNALETAIEVLEQALGAQGRKMHPEDKAGLTVSNYQLIKSATDRDASVGQLKIILESILKSWQ